jgi:putative transposase
LDHQAEALTFFNPEIAGLFPNGLPEISRWWVLIPLLALFAYGFLRALQERFDGVEEKLETVKNCRAVKALLANATGSKERNCSGKPLKIFFDEARFGLINWHKRRYCPKGFSPPYVVRHAYEWTYLYYAAVDPATGESSCLYLPGMDRLCLEAFLGHLGEAYADHHLVVVVLDGAPSHRSEGIAYPENVSLLRLPRYSPELNPAERWFQEVPGVQACALQQGL